MQNFSDIRWHAEYYGTTMRMNPLNERVIFLEPINLRKMYRIAAAPAWQGTRGEK